MLYDEKETLYDKPINIRDFATILYRVNPEKKLDSYRRTAYRLIDSIAEVSLELEQISIPIKENSFGDIFIPGDMVSDFQQLIACKITTANKMSDFIKGSSAKSIYSRFKTSRGSLSSPNARKVYFLMLYRDIIKCNDVFGDQRRFELERRIKARMNKLCQAAKAQVDEYSKQYNQFNSICLKLLNTANIFIDIMMEQEMRVETLFKEFCDANCELINCADTESLLKLHDKLIESARALNDTIATIKECSTVAKNALSVFDKNIPSK